MVKRLSHSSRSRNITLIVVALAIAALVALLILEKTKTTDIVKMPQTKKQQDTKKQQEAEQKAAVEAKQNYLDESVKTPDTTDAVPATTPSSSSMTLSAKQEGDTVTILTQLSGISSGECVLSLQNGSTTKQEKAQIIYQPEFSSCAGFSIAKSSLGAGTWKISLTATPATGGEAQTKTQTLGVK